MNVTVITCSLQVGNLKNMYHFELPGNGGEHSPYVTQALEEEELVSPSSQEIATLTIFIPCVVSVVVTSSIVPLTYAIKLN